MVGRGVVEGAGVASLACARATKLIAGLCEQFWEHIYPLPEADDPEARTGSRWRRLATRSEPAHSRGAAGGCGQGRL
ncbi:type VI secretion system ImpA family N-terminal domain-containing protein [Cupriavidus basilensis]